MSTHEASLPIESTPKTTPPMRLVAVIDIGATAIRMEIAEIGAGNTIRTIESVRQPVELGRQ